MLADGAEDSTEGKTLVRSEADTGALERSVERRGNSVGAGSDFIEVCDLSDCFSAEGSSPSWKWGAREAVWQ